MKAINPATEVLIHDYPELRAAQAIVRLEKGRASSSNACGLACGGTSSLWGRVVTYKE